ncbi:MAG: SLC13 family permease [Schleiferiaceae bacterium]|jgi:di/tricarboxylate transporter
MNSAQLLLLVVYLMVVLALFSKRIKPVQAFGAGGLFLVLSGQLSAAELLGTLTTPSLLILFLLMVLAGAVQARLGLAQALQRWTQNASPRGFLLRVLTPTALLSAVLNNTAVVALLMGPIRQWALRNRQTPSTYLMPLAFAATLGGMLTVIGTSTNLVLNGLLEENGLKILHTSDYLLPGLLVVSVGIVAMVLLAGKTLPKHPVDTAEKSREYTVETRVLAESPFTGKSVQDAGLRQVHGLFLVEIVRGQRLIAPVSPTEILEGGDRLFFAGALEEVRELTRSNSGLALPQEELTQGAANSALIEVMIPPGSDLVGAQVRSSQFRQRYDAAIVAVHRRGERMQGRIGDMVLQAGDLLLVIAGARHDELMADSKHLYSLTTQAPVQALTALKKAVLLVGTISFAAAYAMGTLDFLTMLLGLAATLAAVGWLGWGDFKKSLDWELIVVLMCALGFSKALMDSGLILEAFAHLPMASSWSAFTWIGLIFAATTLLTNLMTNVAAVALMFPVVAVCISSQPELSPLQGFLALAFGASNAFLTPFGYQTNLMVMGPGAYQSRDYLRFGAWVTAVYSLVILTYLYVL